MRAASARTPSRFASRGVRECPRRARATAASLARAQCAPRAARARGRLAAAAARRHEPERLRQQRREAGRLARDDATAVVSPRPARASCRARTPRAPAGRCRTALPGSGPAVTTAHAIGRAVARDDHGGHGGALGARRRAVRGVLDVAPGVDAAAPREQRGADAVLRVRRVRVGARGLRRFDEGLESDAARAQGAAPARAIHPVRIATSSARRERAVASTSA